MNDTKNNNSKLNPEIKQKAQELFTVIEHEVERSHEDEVAEAILEEMGDFLKNAKGFDVLLYGYKIAQTYSEQAIYNFEESAYQMDDDTLYTLCTLYKNVLSLSEMMNTPEDQRADHYEWARESALRDAEEAAKKVKKGIGHRWQYRAMSYRRELEKLKKDSHN